jgi:hypothetical protein
VRTIWMIATSMFFCDMLLSCDGYTDSKSSVLLAEFYSVVTRFISLTGKS